MVEVLTLPLDRLMCLGRAVSLLSLGGVCAARLARWAVFKRRSAWR